MKKFFTLISGLAVAMAMNAQSVSVKDINVEAGKTATVNVDVTEATKANGGGMFVILPEGFTFLYDEEEEVYAFDGDVFAKNHSISEKLQSETKLKVAILDTKKNANFKEDEGVLFGFNIVAGADVVAGTYEGTLGTIEFSNGESNKYEDVKFKIVVGDATAINALNADEAGSTIYNVAGTVQNSMKKGVNIVKMNNGQVKKVMVK